MAISPEEIRQIIQKHIKEFTPAPAAEETGTVIQSGDGIARITGLPSAMAGEMIEFPNNVMGLTFNLEKT